MSVMRTYSPFARSIALILMATYVSSCARWEIQRLTPEATVQSKNPKQLRLTLRNGFRVMVHNPRIVGDSLFGTTEENSPRRLVALALDEIGLVEVSRFDPVRTFALVAAGIGIAGLLVAAAAQDDPPPRRTTTSSGGEYISCPLVYSWDGEIWRLDSGTFGGAITRGAARTDLDNLVYATPNDGRLRLKLANELAETDHVDALSLLVIDHDADVTVAPDGAGNVHTLGPLQTPLYANDFRGRDVLARVDRLDDLNWESHPLGRDPLVAADVRDGLELTFVRSSGMDTGKLVIDGRNTSWAANMLTELIAAHGNATAAWYDSLDTQPQFMQQFGSVAAHTGFLGVSVKTTNGWEHQGYVWEAGPEIIKRQVFSLDLSGVNGDTVRVRLESAPAFWHIDQVTADFSRTRPFTTQEINITRAIDHTGRDVGHLLAEIDGAEFVMATGDYAELEFDLPRAAPGKTRSFVLSSTGWYRVHTDETASPQITLLADLVNDRDAASRIAVTRMNEALRALGVKSQ